MMTFALLDLLVGYVVNGCGGSGKTALF